tara:strand:- start:1358 stop:1531 length:174 start_codon:yes stop_codon:yes gene_type:complete
MQVGDLVRHKMNNNYGIIIEIRPHPIPTTNLKMVIVSWPDYVGANMIHPDSQLQAVS